MQPILWKVFEVFYLLGKLKLSLKENEKNVNAYNLLTTKARYKVFDSLIKYMCAKKVEVMNGILMSDKPLYQSCFHVFILHFLIKKTTHAKYL